MSRSEPGRPSPETLARDAVPKLLRSLRLPGILRLWPELEQRAVAEGWSFAIYLHALLEHEVLERDQRRVARRLADSKLPKGKTLATLDFTCLPASLRTRIEFLARNDDWVREGHNLLIFGPSGSGKTHIAAALGHSLITSGHRVLYYASTTAMLQQLAKARRDLALPALLDKLDGTAVLILDDVGYANKTDSDTGLLFELISQRYERRSLIITSNQPFAQWGEIFHDKTIAVAAIDRLVHHATIIAINAESYRRRQAAKSRDKSSGDSPGTTSA